MPTLLLRFRLRLESPPIASGSLYIPGLFGPQFHRWLPDGKRDAITLETGESDTTLRVWFERRGYVDGDLIRFDYTRQEVEPEVMVQQGRLDAGPLVGLLEIRDLSEQDSVSLERVHSDDVRFAALEKRVIRLFYPPVNRFLSILRTQYGQYWVPETEEWDSRWESASSYLNRLGHPEWSLDGGKTWKPFRSGATHLSVGTRRKVTDFREYLSSEDWREIAKLVQQGWQASPAVSRLVEAVRLFDRGYVKHAIIDAVTALEMAISESFLQRLGTPSEFTAAVGGLPFYLRVAIAISPGASRRQADADSIKHAVRSAFHGQSLPKRFAIMANLLGISEGDRRGTVDLIKARNSIVHQGKEPPDDVKDEFSALLNAFAVLLPERRLRFPMASAGNRIMIEESEV